MKSQRDFFNAVLSQGGLPCIAWVSPEVKGWTHKVFKDVQALCDFASTIDYTTANYYFAISTLKEPTITIGGKKRIRVKQNTKSTRCLVLDIDFKDGYYATVELATDAVNELAVQFSLPKPIIVSSGYGIHVYWPFVTGIHSGEWYKLAVKFKKAVGLLSPGLVADASRVSDTAGVLRIPDSFNLKNGGQVPVLITQWMEGPTDIGEITDRLSGIEEDTAVSGHINLGMPFVESPPVELAKVARNCNWFGEYLKHKSVASEPEWYAILGLAPYMELTQSDGTKLAGEQIAQAISKGHSQYDEAGVSAKYAQAVAGQTGPSTCARFQGINLKRCEGCPFATSVKSPIQTAHLARPATQVAMVEAKVFDEEGNVAQQTITIPNPPAPYFRGENGGVFVRVKEKIETQDGGLEWKEYIKCVYDFDLYPVKRFRTELLEDELMEVHLWLPHDGLRIFKMPTALLADQKKLAIFLAQKGAVPKHGEFNIIAKYLVDYIRHMQSIGAAEVEFSRFGWRDLKSANPKFVVGNGYIDKTGTLIPASFAHHLKIAAKSAVTAGSLELWKQGFAGYHGVKDSKPHLLAAMIGFAAPLIAMTEYSGVLYNMIGETACGKSTALQFMTSIFGQPNASQVLVNDTQISMFNFIGYISAMPIAMDELTNMAPDTLSNFALNFTSGRGKMRANRDGNNQVNEIEWDTIVVGTSNTSLYDKLAMHRKGYTAEAMRILELQLPDSHKEHQAQMTAAVKLLSDNYGHAGRVYISYVIQNIPKITAALEGVMAKLSGSGGFKNEERFWSVLWATVYVGGCIAKNLGLHTYDVKELLDWGTSETAGIREAIKTSTSDPVSILSDFLNSNLDTVIKFKDDRPYLGPDGRALQNLREVKIRMELNADNKATVAYISTPAFKEYCDRRTVDSSWLSKLLMESGILVKKNLVKRLSSGSSIESIPIKCWEINMLHSRIIGVLPE